MNLITLKLIINLFLIIAVLNVQAENIDYKTTSNDFTLIIKPNICVAPRGMTSCISSFDINWESKMAGDFCLTSGLSETPLKCWQDSSKGFYRHKLIITENINYWLNRSGSTIKIINALVKFAALKPHRKHQRRRNRLPWSISSL